MNRFLKNKKEKAREAKEAKEAKEAREAREIKVIDDGGNDSIGPMKSFKKHKKPEPEKLEFDFANALPSNEDFRTSLLMPKLSARFSMLKEQDDPDSLLGKASDDSVLAPKRASRLNALSHKPSLLSDIDELSIEGSRHSFRTAGADSHLSGGEGYGTDDDRLHEASIMNRPRPGEGNNLFGGRQKVYKIPVKSDGTLAHSETGRSMGGRAVYEEDITISPFQRLKMKEREERAEASPAQESDDTLSQLSSAQRTTFSSTTSGPGNGSSTPATPIDDPFPRAQSQASAISDAHSATGKPPSTTSERGSVRSRRLYGQGLAQAAQNQQSSTFYRLESLSRQRAGTPELPHLNRNYSKSTTNLRDRLQKLDITEPASTSRPTSPPSSVASPSHFVIENGLRNQGPNPNQAGSIPPLTPPISENEEGTALAAAVQPEDRGKATAMGLFNKPVTQFDEQQFTRRQLQMYEGRNTPPLSQRPSERAPQNSVDRQRGLSNSSSFLSRAESASSQYTMQRATDSAEPSPARIGGTFFADSRSSDSEEDETDPRRSATSSYSSHAFDNVHPAFRSGTPSKPSTPTGESQHALPEVRYSDLSDLKPIEENDAVEDSNPWSSDAAFPEKPDSPTLPPAGLGLSGLVRTHLRRESDRFSSHPPRQPPGHGFESLDGAIGGPTPRNQQSRIPLENREVQSATLPLTREEDQESDSSGDEFRGKHRRNGSTETQREREEFEQELAERRRKVQEKLKSFAEAEGRTGSPGPGSRTPDFRKPNAFAMLKSKSSKQAAGSVFGLGNASTPSLAMGGQSREETERLPYSFGKHSNASSPHVGAERPVRSRLPNIPRSSQENSRESSRSRGPSPQSSFRPLRDRSGSETSGRSKSAGRGKYPDRDELGPLDEGSVASPGTFMFPDHSEPRNSPTVPSVPSSARPSTEVNDPPYDRSTSTAGRYRSGSRSGTSSHPDAPPHPQHPPPLKPSDSMIGVSPRPSPVAPYSANPTPPLYDAPRQQSPGQSPGFGPPPQHGLPQRAPGHVAPPKRAVSKYQISEPTFVSSTSNVPTVGLPPGASLSNGVEAPPVPPMNPRRRRQTAAQTFLGALKGDRPELHHPTLTDEQRSVSEGMDKSRRAGNRLQKSSSEGVQLNGKTRQEAVESPPPSIPHYPPNIPMDGGMI